MQSSDIRELRARKKALIKEMEQIQTEIETSLSDVRTHMSDRMHYRYWIVRYPLHVTGTAIIAGFLLARKIGGNKSSGEASPASSTSEVKSGISFSGLLLEELKKMITRRAVNFMVSRIEEKFEEKKEPSE